MTEDTLKTGNKILEKLKEKREFLKAYNAPYINTIRACDFKGEKADDKVIYVEKDSDLSKAIIECVKTRIAELEKQLEEL